MMDSKRRIAIIGAGPIGLEAALYGATLGDDVRVFERIEVGGNILDWGHVRMFSPWKMNVTPLGRRVAGLVSLVDDECPTGREFAESYLFALAQALQLRERIFTGATVIHTARKRKLKHDDIGHPRRSESPFRLMVRHASGKEVMVEADVVIDASGVYSNPSYMGDGGIPALGELVNRHRIVYRLDDILGADRAKYEGKTTLVVGAGHSAATTIVALKVLADAAPKTRAIWAVRANRKKPFEMNGNDPLSGRAALMKKCNELAEGANPGIQYLTGCTVESIAYHGATDQFDVVLNNGHAPLSMTVDRVIAHVGLGPDNSIYRQLQVHECYATLGPMQLAAVLLGETSADCLAQQSHGPDQLKVPEPDFFIVGHKSYGTRANFLLRVGHEQVRDVFKLIHRDPNLDLYQSPLHEASIPAAAIAR